MKEIDNILTRNSPLQLCEPYPSDEQMDIIYKAALRAPDHAWLRPSRFLQVTGDGLDKLSKIFYQYAKENMCDISEDKLIKYKKAPFRAPMIIILITNVTNHPSVPEHEQMFSTAAAAQNILLALHAFKFGGIWRTGKLAFNRDVQNDLGLNENQEILGYLYVGTETGVKKKIPELDIDNFVSYL